MRPDPSPALTALQRWERAGGTWRVRDRRPGRVVVDLCRCDGGEVVDVLESTDADLVAYVDATREA